jgi:hypothetical protein
VQRVGHEKGQFCPVADPHLAQDLSNMHLYGAFAQIELAGDHLVRLTLPQQIENLQLPRRQPATISRGVLGYTRLDGSGLP